MLKTIPSLYTDFLNWKLKEYLWFCAAVSIVCFASFGASALEYYSALTNVVCVILVAKGRISNYYWGAAGVVLYGIVAYNTGLYANAILNVIYLPMQFIGIYLWQKDLENKTTTDVTVKRLTLNAGAQYLASGLILWFATSWLLKTYTDDPFPVLDSFCLVASLIAMVFMLKQYPEQWVLWILVNCVTIYLWVIPALDQPGAWAQVAQWSVFLLNAFYGAWKWYVTKTNK